VDSPDKHLRVADLASEEEEMLPDDPLDLDEELITGEGEGAEGSAQGISLHRTFE
jgi:hypothetical protein